MSVLDRFRLENIFGGGNSQTPNYGVNPTQPPQPDENIDVPSMPYQRGSYYTPPDYGEPTPAMDKFRSLLDTMPNRPRPSIMRQIGVGALSFANAQQPDVETQNIDKYGNVSRTVKKGVWQPYGVEETNKLLNMPYEQELGDWSNRAKVTQQAAQLERQSAADRALQASRYAMAADRPARTAIAAGELDRRTVQGNARINQNQQKIDQNQQKIDHIMTREDLTDSEKLALTNKYKKEQIDARGEIDRELQSTRGSQRLEQIGAKGEVDKDIQELRGRQALEQVGARGEQARETKVVTPGGSNLPHEQKINQQLKANQAIREHPEWSQYISTDASGMVQILPPATGFFSRGPNKETYDAIVNYLGGGATGATEETPTSTTAPKPKPKGTKPKTAATTGGNKIEMYAPDGKSHRMVPENMVQTAIEQGYSYVR